MKIDSSFEGKALIDLMELGSIFLANVFCLVKIPKSPNWLLMIENSNFLIFDKILLQEI